MSEPSNVAKSLRDRLGSGAEDRFGKALSELLESPLLTGAIGRAFDAREKASQAQEVALGALNIPSAADIERLTRRLRSVSHRLEAIEDGVDRLDRALAPSGVEARLSSIEQRLDALVDKLDRALARAGSGPAGGTASKRAGTPSGKRAAAPSKRVTKATGKGVPPAATAKARRSSPRSKRAPA
jgi:hypothetical protein